MNQLTELCPSCIAQWNCKYVIRERKIKDNTASLEISCTLKMGRTEVDKKIKFILVQFWNETIKKGKKDALNSRF
jgi:hypothetical protein